MKIAAIDIGTNAVRAKVFETSPVAIEFVEGFRSPLRLGTEVFREGRLSKSKLDSLISTLMKYKTIFEEKRVTQYRDHRHFRVTRHGERRVLQKADRNSDEPPS